MRFLLDQDVYAVTGRFLRELGHDVRTAADSLLSRALDSELLVHAAQGERILVTRDKDFGGLVFVERKGGGVIFLRITPSTIRAIHAQLQKVLQSHTEAELRTAFVVVEAGQYRLRRLRSH